MCVHRLSPRGVARVSCQVYRVPWRAECFSTVTVSCCVTEEICLKLGSDASFMRTLLDSKVRYSNIRKLKKYAVVYECERSLTRSCASMHASKQQGVEIESVVECVRKACSSFGAGNCAASVRHGI